jgi:beta-alanine degradation protein BauB
MGDSTSSQLGNGFDAAALEQRWRSNWPADAGTPSGPPASRIIFENPYVRVWSLELEPGQSTALHTHMHPYLFVVLEPSTLSVKYADGSQRSSQAERGNVIWAGLDDATRTHVVVNVGERVCVERLIEIL